MDSVMVDIETLATSNDAVILSIGAAAFDMETGDVHSNTFYVNINPNQGRRADDKTLQWWSEQSEAARAAFENPQYPKQALKTALGMFNIWYRDVAPRGDMWSHSFDKGILHHAFDQVGFKSPWHFRGERDIRTLGWLYKQITGRKFPEVEREGEHHNALDDALHQIKYCHAMRHAIERAVSGG